MARVIVVGSRFDGVTIVLVAALVVSVALAGCRSYGEGSPEPTAGSQTARRTTPSLPPLVPPVPADPAAEALAAYAAMWGAYDRAARDPRVDTDDAGLGRFAAGDGLAVVSDLVASLRENGLVTEGSIDHFPEVTELSPQGDPTSARVEDCADTSDRGLARANGGPYRDQPGGLRLIFADVELQEGMWMVTALGIGRVGSCQR